MAVACFSQAYLYGGCVPACTVAIQDTIEVYILAGQSNAAGVGDTTLINNVRYEGVQDSSFFYDYKTKQWQNYHPGYTFEWGTGFGIEDSFLKEMYSYRHKKQYLIKYAWGGSYLYQVDGPDWNVNSIAEYNYHLKHIIRMANDNAANAGHYFLVKAVIWIHGESDANNATYSAAYRANMEAFFTGLRAHLKSMSRSYNFPVVLVRLKKTSAWGGTTMYDIQTTYCTDGKATLISTDDAAIAINPDNVHYSTTGLINLGINIADSLKAN
jgi:hypothetical protein